jgi:hypothetical protein
MKDDKLINILKEKMNNLRFNDENYIRREAKHISSDEDEMKDKKMDSM